MKGTASITALVVAMLAAPAIAQERAIPDELAWVGLFNEEMVSWLNNEYRLEDLCGERTGGCRDSLLAPRQFVIGIHDRPGGQRVGDLVVRVEPGKPLELSEVVDGIPESFEPDVYLEDWGYGPPWFHLTILDRHDGWYRVSLPRTGLTWINQDDIAGSATHVEIVHAGDDVYSSPRGNVVILGIEDGVLIARAEQEADMWCSPEDVPALRPWTEIRISFMELFDERSRLLLRPSYMKGC